MNLHFKLFLQLSYKKNKYKGRDGSEQASSSEMIRSAEHEEPHYRPWLCRYRAKIIN